MKKMCLRVLALLLAVSMLLSLAACGSSSTSTSDSEDAEEETSDDAAEETSSDSDEEAEADETSSDEPQYGGSATFYCDEIYNLFDPQMDELNVYALWFESLWAIDWDSDNSYDSSYINYTQLQGQIAESWEIADDYSSLTVTIRDDVYFQDKTSVGMDEYDIFGARNVTAEDVKYSYDRLLGIGSGFDEPVESSTDWSTRLYMLESVEVTDTYTVVFYFNTATEVALDAFMVLNVNITGHEWDELTEEQQSDWHYACGTGPYILTDFYAESYAVFTRNDNYYCYDERYPENQLPYLDTITLTDIDDSANLVTQFIAGELDYIGWANNLLSDSEIQQLEDSLDSSAYIKTVFSNSAQGIGLRCNQEPFDNLAVRTALQMAINIEEMHSSFYGYDGDPVIPGLFDVTTEWSAIDQWDDDLIAEYTYDPEGAIELLEEAGYADGFEFTVTIASGICDPLLYQQIATYFAAIGVTMNIESEETAVLNTIKEDETSTSAFFITGGNLTSLSIPSMTLLPENGLFYDNEEFESLITEVTLATSLDEQIEIANQLDLIYSQEHYVIQTSGNVQIVEFMSSKIGGYTGEKLRANSNYRTVLARIWSTEADSE